MSFTFLALGDSYTIGEGLPVTESFPYQAVDQLRRSGQPFYAPEIVARSGWTTDELAAAMQTREYLPEYDLVTLLIGVNNQYRGRPVSDYRPQFDALLRAAIQFAAPERCSVGDASFRNRSAGKVFVLSIPDWGVTPFASARFGGLDPGRLTGISREIDGYNSAAREICVAYGVDFIDITASGRALSGDPSFYVEDGLHPAAVQLKTWATALTTRVLNTTARNDRSTPSYV
jgi:hypothetical protein